MLSHLIRATIPLPLTLGTSSNRAEVSSLGVQMHAIFMADALVVTLEGLGAWGVGALITTGGSIRRCWSWYGHGDWKR
jgi:hypothetical protein